MNAQELRHGNNVFFDSDMLVGKYPQIATIEANGVRLNTGCTRREPNGIDSIICTEVIWYNDIHPIPLTEEILLKAMGFQLNYTHLHSFREANYDKNDFMISHEITENGDRWLVSFRGPHVKILHFVHEFQNLYWVLTGNELEIKL